VPFSVYRFTEFEVFWSSTVSVTAHEQFVFELKHVWLDHTVHIFNSSIRIFLNLTRVISG